MTQRKPYNPNTKYGQRKLSEKAQYNYDNGTDEHRQEIDSISNVVWLIIIVFIFIIGFIIYSISGTDGLIKWLK